MGDIHQEFYAKAAEATSLLQQQPEIFDAPYKGMQSENGGVVGMLEVIESDFARLESDTKAAEATAQKEYDTFMTDSKVLNSRSWKPFRKVYSSIFHDRSHIIACMCALLWAGSGSDFERPAGAEAAQVDAG